ncbi:cytochrome P450 [Bradyrhizobium sp. LHD-71]|uniref:cytochrome P450 n=1 Tax=Bradyrhizobium sp. LHD-71 TaxID=3072141 RepID=UPI00280D2052|nr:cytochrome P450 [Bradyrhizobium sp. LHD-71]MDQ8730039.1 cytochrome P450 [Bradyrhizobium sp. LHD-71]
MSLAETLETPRHSPPLIPPRPAFAPPRMSTFARIAAMRRNAIDTWGERAYQEDIVKGSFLGRASFTINAPDAIKHVLIDNYENYGRTHVGIRVLRPILGEDGLLLAHGKAWKHQRRTLAPAFSPRAVSMLVPHMLAATDTMVAELKDKCGGPADLREAMQRLALDIAGRTMFSFSLDRHGARLRDFVNNYGENLAQPHFLDVLFPLNWPSPRDFARRAFRREWTQFLSVLIAERRALGASESAPRDLFDLMVAARDPETGDVFSDAQLADQVATMILAGHETTATALFWSLFLLSLDQVAQDNLAAEAQAEGANLPGELDISRLKFTRAVLDEALRLYPPAFLIARAALGPDTIAGEAVDKRDVIFIAPWLLHRHERLWTNPNAFMPERFLPGAPPPDRFAYLPFGVGPRVCIGAQFALTEATLALAKIVASFSIELTSTRPVMPVGIVTTQPDHSPEFRIMRR